MREGSLDGVWEEVGGNKKKRLYRLNISDIISTSVSAAAIFSVEESWGRPPKRKDILTDCM